jgi:3',5'-nucleoside bisphosphate phosphatase
MKTVKADLHIHTVLSPCGDLDMSPRKIVEAALEKDLGIIGITDHNSTLQIEVVEKLAAEKGIFVLGGVEITTREEVHCLAFFPDKASRTGFQHYIDIWQPVIPNREGAFGYQVVVDADDQIVYTEEKLLITALNRSIGEIEKEVHRLGGLFIPAHIDRSVNSILSQLGFFPRGLQADALEITCFTTCRKAREQFKIDADIPLIRSSDAHYPVDIGKCYSIFILEEINFQEIAMAFRNLSGRCIQHDQTK